MSSGKEDIEDTVAELAPADHVVCFYERDDQLAAAVSPYLATAIRAGDAAVGVASEEHARGFANAREASGIDTARAREEGFAATFAADLKAPARARNIVASALLELGYERALVNDAALVVSELAANAARHAGSPFSVIVREEAPADEIGATLHVAVEDARALRRTHTERMRPAPLHGLSLVDAVATRWGVEPTPGGKAVWAKLHVPTPANAPRGGR